MRSRTCRVLAGAVVATAAMLLVVVHPFLSAREHSGELYVITSGDTVLVGGEIEYYRGSTGVIELSDAGARRWTAHSCSQYYDGREILKLSTLTGQRFVLEVAGDILAEGHFTSTLSSVLYSGLTIWDSFVRPGDTSVRLAFASSGSDSSSIDPRELEAFVRYCRSRGKLKGSDDDG